MDLRRVSLTSFPVTPSTAGKEAKMREPFDAESGNLDAIRIDNIILDLLSDLTKPRDAAAR